MAQDMSLTQIQQNPFLNAIVAPYLQPGAQYQQTESQIPLTQQEQQTSAQSAATSGQEQANAAAANPGVAAQSQTQQAQATQNVATLAAGKAIKNGMSLGGALKTFTALGMKPDDVFQKYLSESPYGLPQESPTELQSKGISANAIGKIGDNGSFADRWNTRNALLGLRDMQDKFHKTGQFSEVANVLGLPTSGATNAAAYNSAKDIFNEHLSSLIPGGSNASSDIAQLRTSIPDAGQYGEYTPGKADAQFQSVEDQLLKAKGYKTQDLGLPANSASQTKQTSKGGDLLHTLLQGANNDLSDMNKGMAQNPLASSTGPLQTLFNPQAVKNQVVAQNPVDVVKSLVSPYVGLVTNPKQQIENHPLETAQAVIAPLLGLKPGEASKTEIPTDTNTPNASNLPGNLKTLLTPGSAIRQAGNIRNSVVKAASDAGKTINGNAVISDLKNWATEGKMGNLGQGHAIDQAIQDAKSVFGNKKIDPQTIMNAYKEADSGFTRTGIQKTPIQANIDRGLRDVLGQHLDTIAPGWKDATTSMAKGYKAQKSPIRTVGKRAIGFGLGMAGYDSLRHVLGL